MGADCQAGGVKFGAEYLDDLCKMYENFFFSFGEKVAALVRRQEDMVDSLKFRKGDSVYNVCATKNLLDELARHLPPERRAPCWNPS